MERHNSNQVLVLSKSKHKLHALTFLAELSDEYKLIKIVDDPSDIYQAIADHKPGVIAMNLEWYKAQGADVVDFLKSFYHTIDLMIQKNIEDVRWFRNNTENDDTPGLTLISVEQYIMYLIEMQKGRLEHTGNSFMRVIDYYLKDIDSVEVDITTSEEKVLVELGKGFSYKQIAENLFLSVETIKTHMRNIYRKLEVNNSTSALLKARRIGIF